MPSAPRPPFRPDLEGLRGLAALLVVLYHAGVPGLGGGFVGVDVFFVLSGYFTARALAREYAATGAVDAGAFYARRARRLVPALLVVVAATLALAWAAYAPIDRAAVAADAVAAALGNANHHFAAGAVDYFGRARSPLLHAWTLGVELQASLAWPLLFAGLAAVGAAFGAALGARATGAAGAARGAVARRTDGLLRGVLPGLAAAGVLSFGLAVWLTRAAPAWAFYGTAARAWEFALGGLLAVLAPHAAPGDAAAAPRPAPRRLALGGLAALAAAVALYDRATPYPGVAALLPAGGAAALVAGGGALRALAARPLRALGRVSYGWYLWHWPLMVTGAVLYPAVGVPGRLAWAAAALGLAVLTERWVERPLRADGGAGRAGDGRAAAGAPHGPHGYARPDGSAWPGLPNAAPAPAARPGWAAAGAAAAACLAVALLGGALRAAAERGAARPEQRAFAAAREDAVGDACWASYRGPRAGALPADGAACTFGDPRAERVVALFGDSHAQHWLAALDQLGRARGFRVAVLVMGGCPVADAPELARRGGAERGAACARFREAAVRRLVALRPASAVLASTDAYVTPERAGRAGRRVTISAEAWGRGLGRTYAQLAGAGVPVLALRDVPAPGVDVPACLSRRAAGLAGAGDCTYARAAAVHPAARAAQAAAVAALAERGLPVRLADADALVCAAPRCAAAPGGVVAFTDGDHLTAGFARAAAAGLGARLDAALPGWDGRR